MPATRRPMPSDLSADELQAAWAEVRGSDWPSFPELQRAMLRYRQVCAAALRRRGYVPKPAPWPPAPPLQATPTPAPPAPAALDRKRLAAGERDDD